MELEVKMDSEFVVKQMNAEYKVLNRRIEQLFLQVWNLRIDFGKTTFIHITRDKNVEADKLVNKALGAKEKTVQGLF